MHTCVPAGGFYVPVVMGRRVNMQLTGAEGLGRLLAV
jgi:hypothetical protein